MADFHPSPPRNRILPVVVVIILGLAYMIPKLKAPESLPEVQGPSVLAVFPFDSQISGPGKSDLGAIFQDLIITDMTGLQGYRILSGERLLDIQKTITDLPADNPAHNLILDIARSAKAGVLVTGRIFEMGRKTVVTSKLLRSVDGVVLSSHKVEGQDLYHLVDILCEAIRQDLEPRGTVSDPVTIPVAEKTTSSIPAYSEYMNGVKALNSAQYVDAIRSFDMALKEDPFFKKALFKKVMAQWWAESHGDIRARATEQTLDEIQSRDIKLSNEEKFMVEGLDDLVHQRYIEARDVFQDLVHLRPDEKEYWYNLGEAYFHGGGEELRALDAMEHTLKLDPDFELAYVHILDIYMLQKFYERGLEFTGQILKKNPLHPLGVERRAQFLTVIGDFDQALELLNRALNSHGESRRWQLQLAETHYFAGDYDESGDICHAIMEEPVGRGDRMRCLSILTSSYLIRGAYLEGARDLLTFRNEPDTLLNQVVILEAAFLAGLGGEMAPIDEGLGSGSLEQTTPWVWYQKMIAAGFLAYLNQDHESWAAIQSKIDADPGSPKADDRFHFQEYRDCLQAMMDENYDRGIVLGEALIKNTFPGPFSRYLLAIAYWKSGRTQEALNLTSQMQSLSVDPANYNFNYPRSYYLQTLIYSDMGETEKALRAYGKLKNIWQQVNDSAPEWRLVQAVIETLNSGAS